jgi:hypothetical protein
VSKAIEVITSVERRRRWRAAEKERLVAAASLEPGASVSAIAREIQVSCMAGAGSCLSGRASAVRRCGSLRRSHPSIWPVAARSRSSSRAERGCGSPAQVEAAMVTAAAGEDEAKAEPARVQVPGFTRRQATRRKFPDHLPRRRIVHPRRPRARAAAARTCRRSARMSPRRSTSFRGNGS